MALNTSTSLSSTYDGVPQQEGHEKKVLNANINPIARVLLAGVLLPSNSASPLREFRHCTDVFKVIYDIVRAAWRDDLLLGPPRGFYSESTNVTWLPADDLAPLVESPIQSVQLLDDHWHPIRNELEIRKDDVERVTDTLSVMRVGHVTFPAPKDTILTMLPIVLGNAGSLPVEHRRYVPLITACTDSMFGEHWRGQTAY
eukprot:IDg16865t1